MADIDENKQKPVLYLASVGSVIQCYCEIPTLQLSEENKTRFDLKIGIYELDENPNGINLLCEFWVVRRPLNMNVDYTVCTEILKNNGK